jgi:hypothetical protein
VKPRGGTRTPLIATSRAAAFGDFDNDAESTSSSRTATGSPTCSTTS